MESNLWQSKRADDLSVKFIYRLLAGIKETLAALKRNYELKKKKKTNGN